MRIGREREVRTSHLLEDRKRWIEEHARGKFMFLSERKDSIYHSQHLLSIKS